VRDPYDVLGLAKGADLKQVKKVYRKLARDLHPDLHPGDTKAEDRFKEVASAYDFLTDADRKARYDRGEIDASGAPRAERRFYRTYAESGPGARYNDPRDFVSELGGMDIFSDLFGGRATRGRRSQRGQDVAVTLSIDFVDAVMGASREITLPQGRRLKVTIPAGSADGQVLRLKGQGQTGGGGGAAGDLLITLEVLPHAAFTRTGDDIHSEVPVTLAEAVLGGRIEVSTVDGSVTLTVPKGSNTDTRLRLRGKGVPLAGGGRGDHYVTLKVVLPQSPDPELERLVEAWSARHPYRVRRS
jgi:DnaJ-class molecular chaperone